VLLHLLSQSYQPARAEALGETGLPEETIPRECPWTAEQILDPNFWPDG
jgi:hypothetical protein